MTKIKRLIAVLAIATVSGAPLATMSPAEARGGRIGWGITAGLIAGGLIGAAAAHHAYAAPVYVERRYVVEPVTYARRSCLWEARYNRWGEYIGRVRVCRIVY